MSIWTVLPAAAILWLGACVLLGCFQAGKALPAIGAGCVVFLAAGLLLEHLLEPLFRKFRDLDVDRLALEKRELEAIIDSMTEGLLIYDLDFKPVLSNPALRQLAQPATTGTHSLAGDDLFRERWVDPDQILVIESELRRQPSKPRTDIIELLHPNQFLKRTSSPLTDGEGVQIGHVVIYRDITPEVENDRSKLEFISNASHELRTPVTSLKVLIESLVDGAQEDPDLRRTFLEDIHNEADRLHLLVNDLLDVARMESGKALLVIEPHDVCRVIKEAVNTVAPQAQQKGIALDLDLPLASFEGKADKDRLRQVLVNLLANAVKFTEQGGKVAVSLGHEGDALCFRVSDTGIGIPSKDLPHIFDRFFRVARGRSRLQGGSGLGLNIVKQTIDAHQGEIRIESTEGEGTTVTFTIPQ